MSDSATQPFDPYHVWLGIRPEDQPADHYRLLGIGRFEDDHDVIANAADRQMAHLHKFSTSSRAAQAQQLLDKISAARVCLLSESAKAEYDASLRRQPPPPPSAPPVRGPSPPPPRATPFPAPQSAPHGSVSEGSGAPAIAARSSYSARRSRSSSTTWVFLGVALLIGLAVFVAFLALKNPDWGGRGDDSADSPSSRSTSSSRASSQTSLEFLNEAALILTFDQDAVTQQGGRVMIEDALGGSIRGQGADVAYTPKGRAGGGLLCSGGEVRLPRSLLTGQTEFTIAAWVRSEDVGEIYSEAMTQGGQVFRFEASPRGYVGLQAWNLNRPNSFMTASAQHPRKPQPWMFVATALREGAPGKGRLRIAVDDHFIDAGLGSVEIKDEGVAFLAKGFTGTLDEFALFRRALSDQEIRAIYQRGVKERSLVE
jgi:hypothetical protein